MTETLANETYQLRVGYNHPATFSTVVLDGNPFIFLSDGSLRKVCGKCSGSGFLPEYAGIYAGVCFDCNGAGVRKTQYASIEAAEKAIARNIRARAAAAAKRAAEWAAGQAERDAKERAAAEFEAHRENERINAAAATRYAAEVGAKVSVTGTVAVAMYLEPTQYGWSGRMLVVVEGTGSDAGVVVKVTSGARSLFGLERGETVTITGTVKAHAVYEDKAQTVLDRPKVTKEEVA